MPKTAIIAGATGLVGHELLHLLLKSDTYNKVIALTRKPLEITDTKLDNEIIDFEKLDTLAEVLKGDDVFCCLGTTMKKAGSKEKFKKVDYEYPLNLAAITKKQGAEQYLLISALGADKNSSVFYNKVKGEVEEGIKKLDFKSFHVFRPSLLLGPRKEDRVGEDAAKSIFKIFGFIFIGPLKKYKAIKHDKVARAMLTIASKNESGFHIHESKELQNY